MMRTFHFGTERGALLADSLTAAALMTAALFILAAASLTLGSAEHRNRVLEQRLNEISRLRLETVLAEADHAH